MIRKIWIMAATLLMTVSASAQSAFLSIAEQSERQQNAELGGKAVAIFESGSDKLAISSSLNSDQQLPKAVKSGSIYRYELTIDISQVRDRVFTAAVKGTALKAQIKKVFRPNQQVFFLVSEIENPIWLENQSTGSDAYLVNGKACLEFTTPIENLQVSTSPRLKTLLTRSTTASGANLLSLEIDIATLKALRDAVQTTQQTLDAYEAELDANTGEFTSAMAAKEKQLQSDCDAAADAYNEAITITLHAEGTNVLVVPQDIVSSLSVKQKVPFGVMPVNQEAEVITRTSYDQFMLNADQSFKVRKYGEAAKIYQEAADAPDATASQREIALSKKETMMQYAVLKKEAYDQVKRLNDFKRQGDNVSYDAVDECYTTALKNFQNLRNLTNDSYYDEMIGKLKTSQNKLGIVFEGTIIYAKLHGGEMVQKNLTNGGVAIYGVTHQNEKLAKKGGYGDRLGEVEKNGKFHIQVDPNKYAYLLFVPIEGNDSDIKNFKFLPISGKGHTALRIEMN